MKLYKIFSVSRHALIKSLFPVDVVARSFPYTSGTAITHIVYDHAEDRCSAYVRGQKRYKVEITVGNREKIIVRCTCPAAREMTPSCKHAAALLIVITEYFSQWDWVRPQARRYYTDLLDEAFGEARRHQKLIELADAYPIPTFTKPTIIFVRSAYAIYPFIVLVNGTEKTRKIARLIEKSLVSEYDTVLEKIFERNDLFDYFIYTEQGFVALRFDKVQVATPVWQLKQIGDLVELSFICKSNNTDLVSCIPLGAQYALDLAHGAIISVQSVDSYCYKYLTESVLALFSEMVPEEYNNEHVGTINNDVTRFLGTHYQFTLLQNKLPLASLQQRFAFPDKNLQALHTHIAVVDENNQPISLDLATQEWQVMAKNGFIFNGLDFTVMLSVAAEKMTFAWPLGRQLFFELMDVIFDNQYWHLLPAMLIFAKQLRGSMAAEACKKLFFDTIVGKPIPQKFFAKMDDFWTKLVQYDTCKLIYNAGAKKFDYIIFSKADIFIVILALIDFLVEHACKFNVDGESILVATSLEKKLLGRLAEHLQASNIVLYFGQKKVVQKNLSIEIDMQSKQDWFSITPSFYEKDVLLTETEWQRFLRATDLFGGSETELYVFDEKTEKMLSALRTVKDSYKKTNREDTEARFEIPRLHIFTLLSLNKSGIKLKTSAEDRMILKSLHNFTHIPSCTIPEQLQCTMREYQIKGYDWLAFLYQHKFGACLADEMGLGKTVQTIAFLAGIQEGKIASWDSSASADVGTAPRLNPARVAAGERRRPHLVIAPASVIGNWEQEIQKFYPNFITKLYLGSQRTLDFDMIDIVLTTYDTLRADLDEFKKIPFHVVIFDEAQAVKNNKSQRAGAVQQLQALFKLSLTGTPLENNAHELCSIMNITLPGLLPDDSAVMRLIKKGEYQALHERIAPFMLRRTKQEYLQDLPEKTEHNIYLAMTKKQKGFYGAIVDEIKQEVYKAYREKTNAQAGIVALTALLRLRQICAAPALLDKKQEKLSPKIEYLLAEIKNYRQAQIPLLVFSQFVGMLDIVMQFLKKNKIAYLRIDGSVPALERKKIVAEFQKSNKVFVLLLSLKTGGVGLNLTRARVVVHLDPWWNPAVENQASDRVHRIGQEHDVKVIRLIMKDSIEEKMLVLKQKKKELFEAIMFGASGAQGIALTKQDFDFLLVK